MTFDPAAHLPDALLDRIRERAAGHDRDNTFPEADLAELADAGYLAVLVPAELGGAGLGLTISRELAANHGGDLRLLDTGPEGTTFELRLPA